MALLPPVEYERASHEVRAVYDDIRATRKTDYINKLMAVTALANANNRLANGYRIDVDERYCKPG